MSKFDPTSYYSMATDFLQKGMLSEAREVCNEILHHHPDHLETHWVMVQSFFQEELFEETIQFIERHPQRDARVFLVLARAKMKLGNHLAAREILDQLIAQFPDHPQILFHHARNYKELGELTRAAQEYERLIELVPDHRNALNNLGNIYQTLHQYEKGLRCFDRLIDLDNDFVMAYCNKAGLFQKMGKSDEARALFQQALDIDPNNATAFYNLGLIAVYHFDYPLAKEYLEKAIQQQPKNVKYQTGKANLDYLSGDKYVALRSLNGLINTGTTVEDPYLKLSRIYVETNQVKEAIQVLKLLVERNPVAAEGTYYLGILLDFDRQFELAEQFLLRVKNHPEYVLGASLTLQLLYSKTGKLDLYKSMMEDLTGQLVKYVSYESSGRDLPVYNLAYFPFDPEIVSKVTKKYSDFLLRKIKPIREKVDFSYQSSADKVKVGYLSPYFHTHPSAQMICDVLKYHDREKFEVVAFGFNYEKDEMTDLVESNVDRYVDLSPLNHVDAAKKINEEGIHILVSLAGYNYRMKNEVPALRPAPVQVVCMDYHETMQTDFYDYVLKDEVVIDKENRKWYSESIAYLPNCHFLHSELIPSEKEVTRAMYGIPEDAFVFGCLNHPRKYGPEIMQAWFEILKKAPQSVLWLYDQGLDQVRRNIRRLAENSEVDPKSIIFCGTEPHKDHYRRMELIDLYLDTPVYNGHTTCLEALWMSVPVLTWRGQTVSSRLCSSFLKAAQLDDLIVESRQVYIQKAVLLAEKGPGFRKLKERMSKSRNESALFDIPTLTKNLEKAYAKMWDSYQSGEQPHDFTIS